MAGIMAAMKSFDSLGSKFSNNPALKAIQQAKQRKQAQQQAVSQAAGVAGAVPTPAAPPAASADTNALEARIAALESRNSNTAESTVQAATPPPSTPSSMAPEALAAGQAMFGTQQERDIAVDPNIFNRRFN